MGFIKMLFFRKEKQKPKKTKININELEQQYQNLLGDALNEFELEVAGILKEIAESKIEIKRLLESLKNAELSNENIPLKEKHFMEGNRLSYIKAVSNFLSALSEPEEISDESAKLFLAKYHESSEDFKKASFRPGQITTHFFGDIIKNINEQLEKINNSCNKLLALMKSDKVKILSETKRRIKLLQEEIEKNERLLKELEDAERDYEELKKERAVFEQRINDIKKNSAFIELSQLKESLKRTEDEMKMLDAEFIGDFLQIEKALKKFSKGEDDFINKYIEDPVSAVLNDSELKILGILSKTKDALQSGALEIENKKKEKLIEKIDSMSKEKLTKFVISHNDLSLKISNINRQIRQNNSQRNIDDIKYKLEHVQAKQSSAAENIKKTSKQIEELKIAELKEKIEKAFESLNAPIEIEISNEST